MDGAGRVFGSVALAHQTCLALELVLRGTLDDIPMASHTRTPSTATTAADADNPQSMVITSLRSQVGDLVSQVTQLNSKLVQSYDRISDLEDNMHIASSAARNATLKISQLELERTQHLSALNTGLLVEKAHVTSELTRLMERATDEAAQRGMAESARHEIEKDLDDLSAELFGRANTMVAEARLARAKSERRVQDTEVVLKGAEDAVASMQSQMQVLREDKDRTERELGEMRELMGKGKWVERERAAPALSLRLLSTHAPYQEFLLFVAHLRQIRPGAPQPPPMATLLPLPFLARLVSEDSDPTLRLDTAPALNWLTRRAVSAAIHQSQLAIEPVPAHTLLELQAPPGSAAAHAAFSGTAAHTTPSNISIPCALCGMPVLGSSSAPQPSTPASWRPTFFSRANTNTSTHTPPRTNTNSTPIHSPTPSVATSASFYPPSASRLSPPPTPPPPPHTPPTVHVFRVPGPGTGAASAPTLYPLCGSGWCLARLRTTCEAWRFVRRGVVEKVWAEEVPAILVPASAAKPPVPPRRRINVGKLIGMVVGKSGGGTAAANGSGEAAPAEEKFSPPPVMSRRGSSGRRGSIVGTPPPPLPKRSDVRVGRVEEETAHQEKESEKEIPPTPIEAATLFDAEKPDEHHHHHPHANGDAKDDPFAAPAPSADPTDPTQIPLPPSPTFPPPHEETTDTPIEPAPPASSPRTLESAPAPPHLPPTASPVPSRTASPAPPPLPRRAPRRAAPVPPGATTGAKPSEEAPAPEEPTERAHTPTLPTPLKIDPKPDPERREEQEAYVGDVTWEERTWKELVRLREDMFYARVGTVR